jgi:hypothetical protein
VRRVRSPAIENPEDDLGGNGEPFFGVYRVKAVRLAVEGIPTDDARLSGIGGASLDSQPGWAGERRRRLEM